MRVFLDANVLFTAAYNPSGKASLLITETPRKIELVISDYAVEEARRNIIEKKSAAEPELKKLLTKIRIIPSVAGPDCPISLPEKDKPIFLTALAVKATHLLTGDIRDFGPFMNKPAKSCGITNQTVSDFLNCL